MSLTDFAWAVFMYCSMTRASVKSWGRTGQHNAAVGGVPHSAHLVFLAVDVVYDLPVTLAERVEWASRAGLTLIAEGDHDHLQPLGWSAG